ncbi:MAG: DUF6396 domain-containing protein [Burkholderia gladioli]
MKNLFKRSPLILAVLICACTNKDNAATSSPEVNASRVDLAFTCTHEADHLPPLDANAQTLFNYARQLQTAEGPKDFNAIVRYDRIAAANGDYKANRDAQRLISGRLASSPDAPKESVDLATQLIDQGVPGGYFDIGHYLETGYGLKQDPVLALRYFRKAADLGSPEAQAYVAEQLAPHDKAPDIARQMRECAMNQGDGNAATALGTSRKDMAHYPEAVAAFQKGVRAGNTQAALSLENGFKGVPQSDRGSYLGLPADPERVQRYKLIGKFIDSHAGQNPRVPDLDRIAPLPPAKLPEWDGTFQWERERAAAAAAAAPKASSDAQAAAAEPEATSDAQAATAVPSAPAAPPAALVEQLATAKHLDPATGLPLANAAR